MPTVSLPENTSWIKDVAYTLSGENNLEISYYDGIAEAMCRLLAVRDGELELPDCVYDETREESWEGNAPDGERVYVTVQRFADVREVLAAWEYKEYRFAILGNADAGVEDVSSIAKTALYIIGNFVEN
ncbi:MAG: hypothetical protein NC307_13060 [Roseburia sp.]|nr:hypothetical protein [Roseburia sp.]